LCHSLVNLFSVFLFLSLYDALKSNKEELTQKTELPIALSFLHWLVIALFFWKIRLVNLYEETNRLPQVTKIQEDWCKLAFELTQKKKDNNCYGNCSQEILNLFWKSKYEQKKNIARSVTDLGIALCSCFVHNLIFYANLKFPMCHGTLTKQVSHDFSAIKWKIWDQNWQMQVNSCKIYLLTS